MSSNVWCGVHTNAFGRVLCIEMKKTKIWFGHQAKKDEKIITFSRCEGGSPNLKHFAQLCLDTPLLRLETAQATTVYTFDNIQR